MPNLLVALVGQMAGIEVLGIELTPLVSTPSGEVHTIGDITHVTLFREVAAPDIGEHLLGNLAVEPAHTVDFLTGVAGKGAHAESLAVVVGVLTAHADELVPRDAEHLRIAAHVLAKETLVEVVVTCRHGRVHSI